MPVITVLAPALPPAEQATALADVNAAAAGALSLPPDAVHSVVVATLAAATGTRAQTPWPIALLHGRARDAGAMASAVDAVREVLSSAWAQPADQVWVQWCHERPRAATTGQPDSVQ